MHASSLRLILETLGSGRAEAGRRLVLPLTCEWVQYMVRFRDGAQERYQITYTAGIEAEIVLEHWKYRGRCWRQVGLLNRAGERFDKNGLDGRVELCVGGAGDGKEDWSAWRECAYRGMPPSAEREFKDVSAPMRQRFRLLVIADKRSMEDYFRYVYPGTEAVSEID